MKLNKKDKFWNAIMDGQDELNLDDRSVCISLIEIAVLKAAFRCDEKEGWEKFLRNTINENIEFLKEKNNGKTRGQRFKKFLKEKI